MRTFLSLILAIALQVVSVGEAVAQSGIRWGTSAKVAVDRADEMGVPVLFWVTERSDWDDDSLDDLKDAQEDAFRDPVVQALTERYFVPCRVARNSRTLAEAERLGLPTNFGLYLAVITPTGKVLDTIDPHDAASPDALAERLAATSRAYRESVYAEKLKPVLQDPEAPKAKLRQAVRTAWRMRIYIADQDIVGILSRKDLSPEERSRLYQLLASFGTAPCVKALLDAAPKEKTAVAALARAEPAAIPSLLEELPAADAGASERQIAAYRAAAAIAKVSNARSDTFWTSAKPEERRKEVERVRAAAQAVFDAWQAREGRWR
jgi:hypothetical protein